MDIDLTQECKTLTDQLMKYSAMLKKHYTYDVLAGMSIGELRFWHDHNERVFNALAIMQQKQA